MPSKSIRAGSLTKFRREVCRGVDEGVYVTVEKVFHRSGHVASILTKFASPICRKPIRDLVLKPNPIIKNLLVSEVLFPFQDYKILASGVFDEVSEFLYDVILWTFTVIVHEH